MLGCIMDLPELILRYLVAKLRDPERLQRYGLVGNTLLFVCLCTGIFGLIFAAIGLAIAKFHGDTAIGWAWDGVVVGAAAALVIVSCSVLVDFE